MLEINIFKMKIKLSFSFFAILALLTLIGNTFAVLIALLCCLIHEIGHLLAISYFSIPIKELLFYGGGIKIVYRENLIKSKKYDIIIALSGVLANAVCFFLFKNIFAQFAYTSLILCVFNLLPYKYFDGGRVLELIFDNPANPKMYSLYKTIRQMILLATLGFIILMLIKRVINFSLILTLFYIVLSEIFSKD